MRDRSHFRPLLFFDLERVNAALLQEDLQQRVEELGLREDYIHFGIGVHEETRLRAVIVSARDYRTLLSRTKLSEHLFAEHDISLVAAKKQLPSLLQLLYEPTGYRAFKLSVNNFRRAVLLHARPFLDLVSGGFIRLHHGFVVAQLDESNPDEFARILNGYSEGWDGDVALSRHGHEDAMLVSVERYLAIYRERKLRGLGCPDCGSLSCDDWNETVKQIRRGEGEVEIDDISDHANDLLDQVEMNERFILTEQGRPLAVVLPEREFTRLLLDDGSRRTSGHTCVKPEDIELQL